MASNSGLERAVAAGEPVILASGATATFRKSYPEGYDGYVEILLDGHDETERISGLTLMDGEPTAPPQSGGDAGAETVDTGETRAPSRRMED